MELEKAQERQRSCAFGRCSMV